METRNSTLFRMMFLMVPAQPVDPEIIARYAQHSVNVVWIVGQLGVRWDDGIVLDQQRRTMNAIIYRLTYVRRAHPSKMELVKPSSLNRGSVSAPDLRHEVTDILIHQRLQ